LVIAVIEVIGGNRGNSPYYLYYPLLPAITLRLHGYAWVGNSGNRGNRG